MPPHTNRRLYDLVAKNAQRNVFACLLDAAPSYVSECLGSAVLHFHPETPVQVVSAVSRASRLHSAQCSGGSKIIKETSSESKARSWIDCFARQLPKSNCFLAFGRASAVALGEEAIWSPKYPVCELPRDGVIGVLGVISDVDDAFLAIVSTCGQGAVVLDRYCGYLEGEYSESEVVYEVTYWRSDA